MWSSRANAFTIRIPDTDSSASAVSSAIRCWTSWSAGRERRLKRIAVTTTNGTGSSASAASPGWIANMTADARSSVSAFWVRKMRP